MPLQLVVKVYVIPCIKNVLIIKKMKKIIISSPTRQIAESCNYFCFDFLAHQYIYFMFYYFLYI